MLGKGKGVLRRGRVLGLARLPMRVLDLGRVGYARSFRVFVGIGDGMKFVLKTKKAVLPLYEQAFDIEFPLPKLDTLVVRSQRWRLCPCLELSQ